MSRTLRRPVRPGPRLLAAVTLTAGLVLVGCSSGGSESSGADGGAQVPTAANEAAPDAASADSRNLDTEQALRSGGVDRASQGEEGQTAQPAVIQRGSMTVESDDVARARFDLGKVVDSHEGTIADEKTTASSGGEVRLSRLVLRVPSESFEQAMTDLGGLGKVTASTRKAEDVTGEVIDTRARIRAQEQSLARVELLFARAEEIRDIVAIEAQLSRRQAALDSLKGQLAWLADQSSLATITVYLERTPGKRPAVVADDDSAFVAGLKTGWHALAVLGGGLAAVAGAVLPFAVAVAVLGLPLWLVVRRWLVRHPLRRPTAEV